MSRDPHPFEQQKSEHPGWDRKHFDYLGRQWSLLVINTLKTDCSGELKSLLSDRGSRAVTEYRYWPSSHIMSVPCRLTVDAAVEIIQRAQAAFEIGRMLGADEARESFRRVIGVST